MKKPLKPSCYVFIKLPAIVFMSQTLLYEYNKRRLGFMCVFDLFNAGSVMRSTGVVFVQLSGCVLVTHEWLGSF